MVKIGENLRVRFRYLIQQLAQRRQGPAWVTVVRAGKELSVELPVAHRSRPMLIPDLEGEYPPYFIYGPLVFSTATSLVVSSDPLDSSNSATAISALGHRGQSAQHPGWRPARFPRRGTSVLVASPILPLHKLVQGLRQSDLACRPDRQRRRHQKPSPLGGLVLRDTKDEFLTIKFAGRWNRVLGLRAQGDRRRHRRYS